MLVFQLLSINVSNGAQISTNLIREFNNYLINSQNTYQKLTQELQANYLAQTSEANVALSNALKEFSQVNKIKV